MRRRDAFLRRQRRLAAAPVSSSCDAPHGRRRGTGAISRHRCGGPVGGRSGRKVWTLGGGAVAVRGGFLVSRDGIGGTGGAGRP
jgi:hypothetical protein